MAFLPVSGAIIVAANLSTIVLMPRFGPRPLVAFGLLAAAGRRSGWPSSAPHTGYAAGVVGPLIVTGTGMGMVFAPAINAGTFGVAPQDAGVASATLNVGQQLGASIGTSLLNSIFAAAATAYLAAHLASARLIGRQALAGQALVRGYTTAFWWTAGDLRRRRGHLRGPAPQRAAGSAGHAVPGARHGAVAGAGRDRPRRPGVTPPHLRGGQADCRPPAGRRSAAAD